MSWRWQDPTRGRHTRTDARIASSPSWRCRTLWGGSRPFTPIPCRFFAEAFASTARSPRVQYQKLSEEREAACGCGCGAKVDRAAGDDERRAGTRLGSCGLFGRSPASTEPGRRTRSRHLATRRTRESASPVRSGAIAQRGLGGGKLSDSAAGAKRSGRGHQKSGCVCLGVNLLQLASSHSATFGARPCTGAPASSCAELSARSPARLAIWTASATPASLSNLITKPPLSGWRTRSCHG